MINKLKSILLQKHREVTALRQCIQNDKNHPIAQILRYDLFPQAAPRFKEALTSSSIAIIAEIKRKSPSKGLIAPISDPVKLAQHYIDGGANALSILTDQNFFGGHINDLMKVADAVSHSKTPILRKDFIIDKLQIAEAASAGATAVLCIVSVLGKQTKSLIDFARSINIDVLVEVYDHDEILVALDCGAEIIGINNRNLKTFQIDTNRALELVSKLPDSIIKVAESGIQNPELVRRYYHAGFNAVLIGETLVRAENPRKFIQECRCVS